MGYRHTPGTPWKQFDHVTGYRHLSNADLGPTEKQVEYLAGLSGGDPEFIRKQTKAEVAFAIDAWKKKAYKHSRPRHSSRSQVAE
jgi:hypothetical protein